MKSIRYILIALAATASLLPAASPEPVEIVLDGTPPLSLVAQRGKPAEFSATKASKFRILPGLANPGLVSLELQGAKGFFLRHMKFVLSLEENQKKNAVFNKDATFKMIDAGPGKVRFETLTFPGMFIAAKADGSVVIMKDPPADKSTFILRKQSSQATMGTTDIPESQAAPAPAEKKDISSPGERIKQIKQLLDKGLIKQEEYDRRVKEILDAI